MNPNRIARRVWPAALLALGLVLSLGAPARAEGTDHKMEPLFKQHCMRCHNINGVRGVCPDLSDIGARRDEAYIRTSILEPNAYVVPGFPKDVMPFFKFILKPEEVDKLVAYLETLKGQTVDKERVGKGVKW